MTGDVFRVTGIRYPEKSHFDSRRVQMMVINAMKKQGDQMKKELESTTSYWEHKPIFNYKMHWRGGSVYIKMVMEGSQTSMRYWHYVNEGTMWRRVVFHPLYIAKSRVPGSFFSNRAGLYTKTIRTANGFASDSKIQRISQKRLHGIRARNWSVLLTKKHKRPFAQDIKNAIERGLNK